MSATQANAELYCLIRLNFNISKYWAICLLGENQQGGDIDSKPEKVPYGKDEKTSQDSFAAVLLAVTQRFRDFPIKRLRNALLKTVPVCTHYGPILCRTSTRTIER